MLLYYITDRAQFPGNELHRREALLENISAAARSAVDFIQLREKDLSGQELESLAHEAVKAVRAASSRTRILINSRTDIAFATGADGVHLRSNDISVAEVRKIWKSAGAERNPTLAVSCHTENDVLAAAESGVEVAVFGPVFEKGSAPATGLDSLRSVTRAQVPVVALGGVTLANVRSCIAAGATGIAGIRLFQQGNVTEMIGELRSLEN